MRIAIYLAFREPRRGSSRFLGGLTSRFAERAELHSDGTRIGVLALLHLLDLAVEHVFVVA